MRIKKLKLKNFRNYAEETVEFTEGLNVIFGKNAQGKTNLAESVFYLCTGSSPRCRRDKQLIKDGETCAEISAVSEGMYGETEISAQIFENSRIIKINGNKITKNADILGNVFGVFFSPRELRLIQDGPDERRRFLNVSISQLSKPYYIALLRYNKILDQRNNLLKDRDLSLVYETLPVWDEQLCKYGAIIAHKRSEFISSIAPVAAKIHSELTDGAEKLEISLTKNYAGDEKSIAEKMYKDLSSNYDRDVRSGFTVSGPHRDDLDIILDGKDAKNYASQGQTRTAALSIKLAEVEIFKSALGEYPVLILDDVMSELDLPRRKKLAKRTEGLQTILTCTHAERALYGKQVNKIKVEGGKVKRDKG